MPSSRLAVWEKVLWYCEESGPHRRALDVGAGAGKCAVLLREYLNHPPPTIDAVEIHEPYVRRYGLGMLYDHVWVGDACDPGIEGAVSLATMRDQRPRRFRADAYDLVILGDSIEHMQREAAVSLLDRCRGWVVISTPVDAWAAEPHDVPSENHVSQWHPDDFPRRLDRAIQFEGAWVMRLRPR